MDNVNTISNIPYALNGYYDRSLLERSVPKLNYTRFAQVKDIPTKNTDTIKFRRYGNLLPATTPLIEGVTPEGSTVTVENITAQVRQYGDFLPVTEWVDWTSEDPVLTEFAEILGDQAGETLDALCGAVLIAGTNVLYASTATDRDEVSAAMKWDLALAKKAVRILKLQHAKKMTRMVMPNQNYGTTSVNPSYIVFIHPDTTYDLKGTTGFTEVKDYPNPSAALPNEVGAMDELRFIESTTAQKAEGEGLSAVDVYLDVVVAMDSYGVTRISGKAMENIRKAPGSAGSADPLNQRGTSGWKASFAAVRLNELHMLRVEHGGTFSE